MTPRRLALAARVGVWVVLLSTVGRLLPLRAMLRLADTRPRRSARVTPQELAAVVDRVLEVSRQRSCWKRVAVLRRYLLLNGVETTIVFGVRKNARGPLDGHAWLERDGEPFLERERPRYAVTFRYPA